MISWNEKEAEKREKRAGSGMAESLNADLYHQVMLNRYHVRSGGGNTKQKRSPFSEAFKIESLAKVEERRHGVHSVALIWYSGRPITREPSIGCDGYREEKRMGHRRAPPVLMLLLPSVHPRNHATGELDKIHSYLWGNPAEWGVPADAFSQSLTDSVIIEMLPE